MGGGREVGVKDITSEAGRIYSVAEATTASSSMLATQISAQISYD